MKLRRAQHAEQAVERVRVRWLHLKQARGHESFGRCLERYENAAEEQARLVDGEELAYRQRVRPCSDKT